MKYDDLPPRMAALPTDRAGHPVPWFVATIDGEPDFRVIRPDGIGEALKYDLCWVCGQTLGTRFAAFTIGPMCAVNRNTAEPPSHRDCAVFSARHCPFLSEPRMKRRETNLPADTVAPAGIALRRNPGVALVWITRRWRAWLQPDRESVLFALGDPTEALWFAHGRQADRGEVLEAIDSGMPALREIAAEEGEAALGMLERLYHAAMPYVPA